MVGVRIAVGVDDQPGLGIGIALHRDAQLAPNRAVRAIAAEQKARAHLALPSGVGLAARLHPTHDPVAAVFEVDEGAPGVGGHAGKSGEAPPQMRLEFGLEEHPKPRVSVERALDVEAEQPPIPTADEIHRFEGPGAIRKIVEEPRVVEGARALLAEPDCARDRARVRALVDHGDPASAGPQQVGEQEADRTGAADQGVDSVRGVWGEASSRRITRDRSHGCPPRKLVD